MLPTLWIFKIKEMGEKKKTGFIYKVENSKTHEIYIGATTDSVEIRIKDHFDKASRNEGYKFHHAIATYGTDAFNWEQVDTANSVNELAEKEKMYINKYNSKEEGYNIDNGGGFQKNLYKYDKQGLLVEEFECLEDAAKTIGGTKQLISRACLEKKLYKNFYWAYKRQVPFIPGVDKRLKKVFQYTLDGVLINQFKSVSEASKYSGISKGCIARVCRGEREKSGGFIWRYGT